MAVPVLTMWERFLRARRPWWPVAAFGAVALANAYPVSAFVPSPVRVLILLASLGIGTVAFWTARPHEQETIDGSGTRWPRNRYTLALAALTLIAIPILSWRLGAHDFQGDEFQVVNAAAGYHYAGNFYQWDWLEGMSGEFTDCREGRLCNYTRARPHTWLVAKSYDLFGISEWSSRLPSVVLGLLFIPLAYFITLRMFGRREMALLVAVAIAFNPIYIGLFRYARMYALLIPLFLALWYATFRAMTQRSRFGFSPPWAAASVVLLAVAYHVHLNSLILFPVAFLFTIYLAWVRRERRYFILAGAGVIAIAVAVMALASGWFPWVKELITFFGRSNLQYVRPLAGSILPTALGLFLIALGAVHLVRTSGADRDRLTYTYLSFVAPLVFFVWFADRYASIAYVSHLVIFGIMLVVLTFSRLVRPVRDRWLRVTLYGGFVLSIIVGSAQKLDMRLDPESYSSFSGAYREIVERIDPEHDVILGLQLREYYLRELSGRHIRTVDMLQNGQYTSDMFAQDIAEAESGWITWETKKGYHLLLDIRRFVESSFLKLHGRDVDETGVEVYRFTRSPGTASE